MAEISLRAYVKELDNLIEHDQLDEVIAHCRHILQTYPKHLDVYRFLGKAYLEAKRYGDAADIFQRVLSAVPDDFVAHVGMAIVREDEGNLDAAIWHMERAFETNPSNAAIQQELRRLIGRRDGLEPHKVRLTRGALARMYAHGELFPQAIAELRSALQEDADRPDLQVLLADMYWRTGQRTESADICQKILETLPFCREANRIMAAALQAGGRAEDAVTYHRRLASLEPYAALVETAMDDPSRVEANAVRIEKLAWVPGQPVPGGEGGQPEWATSLGVDARDQAKPQPAKRPSWLESLESETAGTRAGPSSAPPAKPAVPAPPSPSVEPAPVASTPPDGMPIPEWMRTAGWTEGTGEAVEGHVSFSETELSALETGAAPAPEGELAPADIPDWLKDIAPSQGLVDAAQAPEGSGPEPGAEEAGWLGEAAQVVPEQESPRLPPGWGTPTPSQESEQEPTPASPAPAVPTWMEEAAPGATETIVTWLGDRSKEALGRIPESTPPTPESVPEPEPQLSFDKASLPEGVPDWLAEEVSWGGAEPPAAPKEETSAESLGRAWLSGVAAAAAEGETLRPEELPWLKGEQEESIQAGMYPEDSEESAVPAAEVPDWIKAIAETDFAEALPPAETAAPEQADVAGWLQQGEAIAEPEGEREGLDWLRTLADAEAEAPEPSLPSPVDEPAAEAPSQSLSWLRDLAEAEPPSPPEEKGEPEEREAPSWLRGVGEETPARSALGRSSAPEWLRGIAEPEPEAAAELSEEATLDWMRGIAEAETGAPEEPSAPAAAFNVPDEAVPAEPAETPEWLNLLGPTNVPSEATSTGEWLRQLRAEGAAGPQTPPPPSMAAPVPEMAADDALDDEQVFQWLEGLAARQGAEPARPTVPTAPARPEAPIASVDHTTAVAPESEEGLEWLEKLAAERGLEPTQAQASAPAQAGLPSPSPEVPDWLKELVAESAPPPAEAVVVGARLAAPAPTADETLPALPDWMVPSPLDETEPPIPLPPTRQPPPAPEPAPVSEQPPSPPSTPPMEELSESWVPPWESLEPEPREEAVAPPEPSAPIWTPVRPMDETLYAPPRKPAPADETVFRRSQASPAPPPVEPEEAPPEPVTPVRAAVPPVPPPPAPPTKEADEEIPDWLQTPIPYVPTRTRPPIPSPASPEPQLEAMPIPAYRAPSVPAAPQAVSPPPSDVEATEPESATMVAPEVTAPAVHPTVEQAAPPAAPVATMPAAAAPSPEELLLESPPPPEPARVEPRRVEAVPPAVPAEGTPKTPSRARRAGVDVSQQLDSARKALATGDYPRAASSYATLIKRNYEIQAIIEEVSLALDRNPQATALWQTLGDAYMKGDRLQDAIEAYRRGMLAA